MSRMIPQESIDVAIATAAGVFGAKVLDVRRGARLHPASRARVVAVAGLAAAFPGVPLIRIAQQFGYAAAGKAIYGKLTLSRQEGWWREDAIGLVAAAVTRAVLDAAQAVPTPAPTSPARAIAAPICPAPPRFMRRWRIARLPSPPRPRDVTPLLMGDPEPGRRQQLEALPSLDYGRSNGGGA